MGHKLSAYTWNLLAGSGANLRLRAHELDSCDRLTIVEYQGLDSFRGSKPTSRPCEDNILLREPRFQVRAALLDHGIPVLAFALEETVAINMWRNEVEALGLQIGPWLLDPSTVREPGAAAGLGARARAGCSCCSVETAHSCPCRNATRTMSAGGMAHG